MLSGDSADLRKVRHMHHRIRGRLQIQCLRLRPDRRADIVFAEVDCRECQSVFAVYQIEQSRAAAVQIAVHNDMVAGLEQFHQNINRRHSCRKRHRVVAALEKCHHRFQLFPRRIGNPRIVKPPRIPRCSNVAVW